MVLHDDETIMSDLVHYSSYFRNTGCLPRLLVKSSTRLPYVRGTKTFTTLPTPRSKKQTTKRLPAGWYIV